MRAAVFDSTKKHPVSWLSIEEIPVPRPQPGEVLLKVIACGVCRTDLHIVEGDLAPIRPRIIPGHQIVGEVVEGATSELPPGTRAGVSWIGGVDGDLLVLRVMAWRTSAIGPSLPATLSMGGMRSTLRSAPISCIRCPSGLDAIHVAPLLCAGIIGFRSLRVAGVERGERVGLFGYGSSATLALQVLRSWDCEVYVVTRNEARQKAAAAAGATWVGDENSKPPVALDRAVTFAPAGRWWSAPSPPAQGRRGRDQRHPSRPDARLRLRQASVGRTPDPQRSQHDPAGCARIPVRGPRDRFAARRCSSFRSRMRTRRSQPSSMKPNMGRR